MIYSVSHSSHFQALNSKYDVIGFQTLNSQPCLPSNIIAILGSPIFPVQMLFVDTWTSLWVVLGNHILCLLRV